VWGNEPLAVQWPTAFCLIFNKFRRILPGFNIFQSHLFLFLSLVLIKSMGGSQRADKKYGMGVTTCCQLGFPFAVISSINFPWTQVPFFSTRVATRWYFLGVGTKWLQLDIVLFSAREKCDCNVLLYLTTRHVFENFGGGNFPVAPSCAITSLRSAHAIDLRYAN